LHTTRAATQRRAGADLIGGGPDPTIEKVYLVTLTDNPDDNWGNNIRVVGDITARYPLALSNYKVFYGAFPGATPLVIQFQAFSFDRGAGCGGVGPVGFTDISGTTIQGSVPGSTIDVTIKEGATVIDFWPGVILCRIDNGARPTSYRFHDPTV